MIRKLLPMGLLLVGLLTPVFADTKKDTKPPVLKEIAPVQTSSFSVFIAVIQKENSLVALRVEADGTVQCKHVTLESTKAIFKTTTVEVKSKLTPATIERLQEAYARLNIAELDNDGSLPEGTEEFLTIQGTPDKKEVFKFRLPLNDLGPHKDRIKEFLVWVEAVSEKLK